jgi:protein ImuA
MAESSISLAMLRQRMAVIERRHRLQGAMASDEPVATGHEAIDAALGGGLARGRLHELFAASVDDGPSAAGFATMLAVRSGGGLTWLRQDRAEKHGGRLYANGLAEIGLDPAKVTMVLIDEPLHLLRAVADSIPCIIGCTMIVELWRSPRELDLTASRRLAMAAADAGVTLLMLRIDAEPQASAAWTRWRIAAAPSVPFEADAPGLPALTLELTRHRQGAENQRWDVMWDRDAECLMPREKEIVRYARYASKPQNPDRDAILAAPKFG